MSVNQTENCAHDNVSWDPGNYLPPFGWEQPSGMFCDDCGEQIEEEEYGDEMPDDIGDWWDTDTRYVLEEEARNPL